jgi:hypothetical protein
MCGRVRLSSDVSEIKLVFSIPPHRPAPNIAPIWNVAQTNPLPVVRYDARAAERSLDVIRWGLVPFWAKDINSASRTSTLKPKGSRASPPSARHSSGGGVSCRSKACATKGLTTGFSLSARPHHGSEPGHGVPLMQLIASRGYSLLLCRPPLWLVDRTACGLVNRQRTPISVTASRRLRPSA